MSSFFLTSIASRATINDVRSVQRASRPSAVELRELLDRARLRDGSAIQELFRGHLVGVHRIVYRLVGPGPDVEDLVQIVFVEAFQSLSSFRGDSLFATWLARIAVRVTMRALKRRPPRAIPLDGAADLCTTAPGPERQVAAREGLAALMGLLAELRPKRRMAFVLHVLEGYAIDDVASILDASPAAVKVRIHDARRYIEARVMRDPGLAELFSKRADT